MTLKQFAELGQATLDYLVASGAIHSGHWLCLDLTAYGRVLFVADEDLHEAQSLWPNVPLREIHNTQSALGPPHCAS